MTIGDGIPINFPSKVYWLAWCIHTLAEIQHTHRFEQITFSIVWGWWMTWFPRCINQVRRHRSVRRSSETSTATIRYRYTFFLGHWNSRWACRGLPLLDQWWRKMILIILETWITFETYIVEANSRLLEWSNGTSYSLIRFLDWIALLHTSFGSLIDDGREKSSV